ncbi:MAG: hypothetical protein MZV49_14550 [Rhodopseudomonas palustris]|nr:hypothetical protein [Rhodopseudomonas palustris]
MICRGSRARRSPLPARADVVLQRTERHAHHASTPGAAVRISAQLLHHHQRAGPQVAHAQRRTTSSGMVRDEPRNRACRSFFITDDNLARNQDWEAIFDRLTKLRRRQSDGQRHLASWPRSTRCATRSRASSRKPRRAGVGARVPRAGEHQSADALKASANKRQNQITEYRADVAGLARMPAC